MKRNTIIITAAIILLVIILFFGFPQKNNGTKANIFSQVPNSSELSTNMAAAGLEKLVTEGSLLHTHQHLDITVNGKDVVIPADIGIGSDFISPVHTHDETGVIHVESPVVKDFTLGQFFKEWGIALSETCVGSYCTDANNKLFVAVNGSQITQPQDYKLKQHDEIEIWYGPKNQFPILKKSYDFAPGL